MILDYSAERVPSSPKVKMRDGKPVLFAPGQVTGIMLHQSDCYFVDPAREHEEVSNEWRARRALKVAAHLVVYRNGLVTVAAPLDWIMNHGNLGNTWCWAIEMEGRLHGQPGGVGDPADCLPLTYEATKGLAEAIKYLVGKSYGIKHQVAHRQFSETRRRDPGYEIWNVGRTIADDFGITLPYDHKWGTGREIPVVWDALARAPY